MATLRRRVAVGKMGGLSRQATHEAPGGQTPTGEGSVHEATAVSFGQTFKEWRRRKFMTQKEVADQIGVRYQTVQRWEAGLGLPYPRTQRKLIEVLGITADELLAAIDSEEQTEKVAA